MLNTSNKSSKQAYDMLKHEHAALKQKLESKSEALFILNKELVECKQARDHLKSLLDHRRDKYDFPTRSQGNRFDYSSRRSVVNKEKDQNLLQLICEMKDQNKRLEAEVETLKQKLKDSKDDITLLRGQIARQRVGMAEEGLNTRVFSLHDRQELISQLETRKQKLDRLGKDLEQVIDEKEELVVERDVYKHKIERLNTELNYLLRGDQRRIVDIDALLMENKYLHQHMHQLEQEKHQALVTVSKYKQTLEKRRTKGILKIGASKDSGVVINQKQVEDLLVQAGNFKLDPNTPSLSYNDLHHLASALYENLNDKTIALMHQRKTNKILGGRVAELEKKLRTLETAGFWSIPGSRAFQRQQLGDVDVHSDVSPVLALTDPVGVHGEQEQGPGPAAGGRADTVINRLRELDLLPPDFITANSPADAPITPADDSSLDLTMESPINEGESPTASSPPESLADTTELPTDVCQEGGDTAVGRGDNGTDVHPTGVCHDSVNGGGDGSDMHPHGVNPTGGPPGSVDTVEDEGQSKHKRMDSLEIVDVFAMDGQQLQ